MSLNDWSDVIRQQGEASRTAQQAKEADMEAKLPEAIANLVNLSNDDLLSLYEQFVGGVFWSKENEIRDKFRAAIRQEIIERIEG